MSLTCYLSEVCIYYDNGTNLPPNHDVRVKVPCKKFLDFCETEMYIMDCIGTPISCDLEKMRRIWLLNHKCKNI